MAKGQSKKEARLQKKIEKQLKNSTSNVRLVKELGNPHKVVRISSVPDISKGPRIVNSKINYRQEKFNWNCDHADLDGQWSWGESRLWTDTEFSDQIQSHMNSLIGNNWNEVETLTYNGKDGKRRHYNKYQSITSLCTEAQDRWIQIEYLDQFEQLFRMRLGTDRRAWGVRINTFFFLIWYERNHKICPPESN